MTGFSIFPADPCNCQAESFIHESAYVDPPCHIGHGTRIMHFTHIMENAHIGVHCTIGHHVTVAPSVMIGHNVRIQNNVQLSSGVIVQDDVFCGANMVVTPLKLMRGRADNVSSLHPTLFKTGAVIGANTTIAAGVTIGQFAFIEAGSVIDSHIPDFALVSGDSPGLAGLFTGWRCACGQVLSFTIADTTSCPRCNTKYARRSQTQIVSLASRSPAHDSHLQSPAAIRSNQGFA